MPFKRLEDLRGKQFAPLLLPRGLRPDLVTEEGRLGRRIVHVYLPDGTEHTGDNGADYGGPDIILPGFETVEWAQLEYLLTAQREKFSEKADKRKAPQRFKSGKQWAQDLVDHFDQKERFRRRASTFGFGGAVIRQD